MCGADMGPLPPANPAGQGAAPVPVPSIPTRLSWFARMAPDGSGVQLCRFVGNERGGAVETFAIEPVVAMNLGHGLISLGLEAQREQMRALEARLAEAGVQP